MADKKLRGVWEPAFAGKHISEMNDEEVDEFSSWLVEQIAESEGVTEEE